MSALSVPQPPVQMALVGFGRFCRNRLIPAFREITSARLVALYHHNSASAQELAAEYQIPVGYGDLQALLANPLIEAVYVTSPNGDHAKHTIAAAQSGKHVLCEKPLATTVADCQKMIESCRQNNVKLMVAHTLRFSPAVQQIKNWINLGKLGRLVAAQALFTYDGTKSPRRWLYDQRLAGGGALMDIGVHCVDALRYLCGEVAEVEGWLTPNSTNELEHTAQIQLQFTSGIMGSVFCSYESPYRSRLEVTGEKGYAYVEPFTLPWAEVKANLKTVEEDAEISINTGNPYSAVIEAFCRALHGLEDIAIPGEEGLANVEIIEKIYQRSRY